MVVPPRSTFRMKAITSFCIGLFLLAPAMAGETSARLDLTQPPSFGEMTKTGLKFPIPDWLDDLARLRSSAGVPGGQRIPPQVPPSLLSMEAEPLSFALRRGDRQTGAMTWKILRCSFPRSEWTEPGDYYPPKLPITDESRISSLYLRTQGDPAALMTQAVETLKVLGVSDAKLDTWISTGLWQNAPEFTADYRDQEPTVRFYLGAASPRAGEAGASLEMTLEWGKRK